MLFKSSLLLSVIAAASYTCLAESQLVVSQIIACAINMNGIEANFMFAPLPNNSGAQVWVEVKSGLTKKFAVSPSGGFEYHIHVNPVGPNNDCAAAGGHLDPTNVGEAKCLPAKPDKCQEGDLSGKHGELKGTESGAIAPFSYNDKYIYFSGATTTIAGRSIVIHNNGTRVACGNMYPYEQSSSPMASENASPISTEHVLASQSSFATGKATVMMAVTVACSVLNTFLTF
ncbi:hypothetical protein FBU30_003164 [Linnemannia zychae]|nr:hypothetical protein FBU30_003164 [Linnemannia zychae]